MTSSQAKVKRLYERGHLLADGFDFGDEGGQTAPTRVAIGLGVQVIDYEVAAFAR